jgi:epoxyqueuosine reductase
MLSRQEELHGRLAAIGFDEVRFARLESGATGDGLRKWLDCGYHADMDWMERSAEKRMNPGLVLEGARSAILLGVSYFDPEARRSDQVSGPSWAKYSLHADYHDSMKAALAEAGAAIEELYGAAPGDYRYYVDTGPVLERAWAARSGVGFIGKNSMLISRTHGNWLFLASILTRLDLDADPPLKGRGDPGAVGLLCGKCRRCMDACPTRAFPQPGVVDAAKCISYQTIENKGVIPISMRSAIGNRIYGCDTCLDVCPWNRFAREGRKMILSSRREISGMPLSEILELTPERFASVFRGTAIKRVKLAGLLRNACIVAGNSGDARFVPALLSLVFHALPMVRAHAVWAVRKLGATDQLAQAQAQESDPSVLEEYVANLGMAAASGSEPRS